MEPIDLTATLSTGNWLAFVGVALILAAMVVRSALTRRVSSGVERWISIACGVALAVGPLLATSGDWRVLAFALAGLVASNGFQRQLRDVFPPPLEALPSETDPGPPPVPGGEG